MKEMLALFDEASDQGGHMDDAACWEYVARSLNHDLAILRAENAALHTQCEAYAKLTGLAKY